MAASTRHDWHAVFQEAALDSARWLTALETMADATGSARGQLIGVGSAWAIDFNWVSSTEAAVLDRFEAIGGGSPEVNYRIAAGVGRAAGEIVHEADYDAVRPALRSDAYLEFSRDTGTLFGCQTVLAGAADGMIGLAVLRPEAEGRTTERQRREFARAARAAEAAVRLQVALEHRGAALVAGTLEALALDALLFDRHGRVGATTPSAEQAVAASEVLRLRDGRLSSPRPTLAREIDGALHAVLSGAGARASVPLGARGGAMLDVFALAARDWALTFQPRAVAVIRDPARRITAAGVKAADVFGLSDAERDVAVMLGRGLERARIADERGVSILTLRTQIRSLYDKTGSRRESEIVALLAGLMQ